MAKNIVVIGLDEANLESLRAVRNASEYDFHQLLTVDELQGQEDIPLPELLEDAQRRLDAFDGTVDAIVGYWDFPVSLMVPILCRRNGLPSAPLEAVLKCEHKYWSRLEQQRVIEEHPRFALIDLDDDRPALPAELRYPVWLKPVKSASSEGAHRVTSDDELAEAVQEVRAEIGRVGEPFSHVLAMVDLPPEIADAGGAAAMVEEASTGEQATVEGYVHDGEVHVYGVVDSVQYPDVASFLRYQYPSRLDPEVLARMADVTRRVIGAIGLDRTTFNVEYFWDAERGRLELLEINPRHSQSHARLFQMVDGRPNHQAMVDLALGREPQLPDGAGRYALAAKWLLRHFSDGVVRRVPTPAQIAELEEMFPGTAVVVTVEEGERLSDKHAQDVFSTVLAELHIGADDEDELVGRFTRCVELLDFEIADEV